MSGEKFLSSRSGAVLPEDYLAGQIGRLDEELEALRKVTSPEAVSCAVEAGIMRAVANPALWASAGEAMRNQAQTAAGGWLLGGLRALFTRAAWILVVLAGLYALGGWGAVAALFKSPGAQP